MIDIRFWRMVAPLAYAVSLAPARRRRHHGRRSAWARSAGSTSASIQIQPSELMKVALVMALAAYYDRLDPAKVSRAALGDPAARS